MHAAAPKRFPFQTGPLDVSEGETYVRDVSLISSCPCCSGQASWGQSLRGRLYTVRAPGKGQSPQRRHRGCHRPRSLLSLTLARLQCPDQRTGLTGPSAQTAAHRASRGRNARRAVRSGLYHTVWGRFLNSSFRGLGQETQDGGRGLSVRGTRGPRVDSPGLYPGSATSSARAPDGTGCVQGSGYGVVTISTLRWQPICPPPSQGFPAGS